jgi:hypothetical protein
MVFAASLGLLISMNPQRPKPPWLFTAGTHRSWAVAVFAALSLRDTRATRLDLLTHANWFS